MSEITLQDQESPAAPAVAAPAPGLLDRILAATTSELATAAPDEDDTGLDEAAHAREIVTALVGQARQSAVAFDKNITRTINALIKEIDGRMSDQLNQILHSPKLLQLEGSWRGLQYLVRNSHVSPTLKIRMVSVKKAELERNFGAGEMEQSWLYKSLHQEAYNIAGGEPYGALIGDYEWGPKASDLDTLEMIAAVSRRSFTPFLSAASPAMLELKSWTDLGTSSGFGVITEGPRFDKWRSFRQSEDASFVALTLPRVLARLPYGEAAKPVEGFGYEEAPRDQNGTPLALDHTHFCWMNAAYALGTRLTQAFSEYGFCTRIRGADSGGRVTNLPLFGFKTADGDYDNKCPTEINIPDNIDYELGKLGFLPLVHYKGTDYAVFFGAQTIKKPDKYGNDDADANAEISARLPYVMASSRFAHNLKVLGRDMIGSFKEATDCEFTLDQWIKRYVNTNVDAKEDLKAKFPLREARVKVEEVAGQPGVYNAVAYLRPWLQMEELTASLRMVARIPGGNRG
ncbi:MAG: type secretion system contractile sheath large subunit [Pseudomonadota bacterium]|jgi:type VI secretion system protein ImpC